MALDLFYELTGPFWPEYLVARELRRKGWRVWRHVCVYNPQTCDYAELDVLAVAHDGLIMAEIKSYAGRWESLDDGERLWWKKEGMNWRVKSPVWQVKRARLALIRTLLQDFPSIRSSLVDATQTYVFLDRGVLVNAARPSLQKAWAQMKIQVLPLADRTRLPVATREAAPDFLAWMEAYARHFRWRWYFRFLHKTGLLAGWLKRLQVHWDKRIKT